MHDAWMRCAMQDGQEFVFTYHNMLQSEAAIMQAIRQLGPFDGICGFSQVGKPGGGGDALLKRLGLLARACSGGVWVLYNAVAPADALRQGACCATLAPDARASSGCGHSSV